MIGCLTGQRRFPLLRSTTSMLSVEFVICRAFQCRRSRPITEAIAQFLGGLPELRGLGLILPYSHLADVKVRDA